MLISIVVAMTDEGVIGSGNRMLWHLPNDMQRFRRLTLGKPVLMGRKTYESIGKPLPNRRNIILTNQETLSCVECEVFHSLEDVFEALKNEPELMVIGGGEIYKKVLPLADILYITYVHHYYEGDVYFPHIDLQEWQVLDEKYFHPDAKHDFAYTFITLKRKKNH